ncbi:Fat storage-inducing transmembrane protein, partial [Peziza echinospora]
IIMAAVYPVTLLLASLSTAIFIPSKNYFSLKSNIFNVFFVKFGWLWTTIVYVIHAKRLQRTSPLQSFLRWALATLWWLFITQWFFGPPIMDRTFLLTGGICDMANDPNLASSELGVPKLLVTSAACKIAKGAWIGGHDLSGHVFMLTHSSLFLWTEILPLLAMGSQKHWNHAATYAVFALLGLWWWMLIMTGVHFHTWREKFTGLIVSSFEWIVVYMYGIRHISAVREVLG